MIPYIGIGHLQVVGIETIPTGANMSAMIVENVGQPTRVGLQQRSIHML